MRRAVWAYSTKRAVRDRATLTLQENKAKAVIAGEKTARTPRFATIKNGSRSLDEASIERSRKLIGMKGYVTNIPAIVMPASLQDATGLSIKKIVRTLRPLQQITVRIAGHEHLAADPITGPANEILHALQAHTHCRTPVARVGRPEQA